MKVEKHFDFWQNRGKFLKTPLFAFIYNAF